MNKVTTNKIKWMQEQYAANKSAKVGDTCKCPSCKTEFVKDNYQQAFCKSKPGTVCKDFYWNNVTPTKRNNKTRISPASKAWMEKGIDENFYGVYKGRRTSEGYKIYGTTAVNEFDEPVYEVTGEDDPGDSMYYDSKEY